ncbi:MAG: caspase family protein [Rhizobiales bacterium]|nr:caspase family protein [Hyphomicrobiales bacterium]
MMPKSSRLLRPLLLLSLAAGLAALGAAPAAAAARLALVIGNGDYRDMGVLPNATNDAELIASTLRDLDFEVVVSTNLGQNAMKRAIKDFGLRLDEVGPDAVGLFYYAGHGLQVKGANYLIPVEAEIKRESDIDIEAVNVDWVLAQMEYAANDLNFLILDACRNTRWRAASAPRPAASPRWTPPGAR